MRRRTRPVGFVPIAVSDAAATNPSRVIEVDGLQALVVTLARRGYRVMGPIVRDGAIVYDEITSADVLPAGWSEEQEAATYRLVRREDEAVFAFASSPQSWKSWLLPSRVRLWRVSPPTVDGLAVDEEQPPDRPLALIGVRSCDLHAIAIQDRVFLEGAYVERDYAGRRDGAFLVAVNCSTPGGTCFCTSLGTGPRAEAGFDLALTEILDGEHRFLAESGSLRGAELLTELPGRDAEPQDVEAALEVSSRAAAAMGRELDAGGLRDLLDRNREHPRFSDAAERCLTCGNCTMVCPTCFCTSVEDVNDLSDGSAERWRTWDSCFSMDYSHIHGGSIRRSPEARYRQWLTHKFGTWFDQFGTSGCVGCGRCITWCPVGIDVTEELAAIRATEGALPDAHA
ncbi:MAG: 4Fe-4S dicluster domain-containing protein [Gaiella sp.]